MSRRALRKIDPALEVGRWFKSFDDLPQPCSSTALFAREMPLEVELGSGKGLFLSSASAAQPTTGFLGLEVAHKYAQFTAARLARRQCENACIAHGDGLRVFRERIAADSLAAIHVYFPDPWWKARHRKRRVMNEAFLADAVRTLMPGGRLHFWTDVEEYFHATLALVASTSGLSGPFDVAESEAQHDLDYRTHFERRMRQHGLPVYRSEFAKTAAAAL